MVPLNEKELMIDLIQQIGAPVILVVQHYLGSINHTLLSAEALRVRRIPVVGIVFNGNRNPASETLILRHTGFRLLLRVKPEPGWDSKTTRKYAALLRRNLRKYELV